MAEATRLLATTDGRAIADIIAADSTWDLALLMRTAMPQATVMPTTPVMPTIRVTPTIQAILTVKPPLRRPALKAPTIGTATGFRATAIPINSNIHSSL